MPTRSVRRPRGNNSRSRSVAAVAFLATALVGAATLAEMPANAHGPGNSWRRDATNDEYALMVLANMERATVNADGAPLLWNDDLGEAARYHSYDIAAHGGDCHPHDDCHGGRPAWRRVEQFYPGTFAGENSAGNVPNARVLHDGWMSSSGHRANILYAGSEFGAGLALGETNIGLWGFAVQDFGDRVMPPLANYPMIPAGAVLPRQHFASTPRELIVNAFHVDGVTSVRAVVNGASVPLNRVAGTARNGTYSAMHTFNAAPGTECVPIHFEARREQQVFRWPASGSILVGITSALNCAERSAGTVDPPPTTPTTGTPPTTAPGSAPIVTIESPTNGARVAGVVTIRAHATDDVKVTRLEVRVDGKLIGVQSRGEITKKWNTRPKAVKPGPHTITVTAHDGTNTVAESITVIK